VAVEVYSVTAAMVLARLPVDASTIDANTEPLSTTIIDGYIEDGAAQLSGILSNLGITSVEDDDLKAQVQAAIIDFAVWKSLEKLPNASQAAISFANGVWLEHLKRYANRGTYLKGQAANKTLSNLPSDAGETSPTFSGRNYEF
jgi:hypothetical protein